MKYILRSPGTPSFRQHSNLAMMFYKVNV